MDAYIGEIRLFPYTYAPVNWAFCQGQTLSITQFTSLYSILGNFYGGDGRTNFALPNLQGRVAVGTGQGSGLSSYTLGQTGGTTAVGLQAAQLASHTHPFNVDTTQGVAGTVSNGGQFAKAATGGRGNQVLADLYNPTAPNTTLAPATLGSAGSGDAHNNLQPYLTTNYCICLFGDYPIRP